ncbi:MAG: hypothetical protein PVI57_20410 [Gemmatimonadota bacterium]|jgi:hypothetical protein
MLLLTAGGITAGRGLSLLFSSLVGSLLFQVGPADPVALSGTAVGLPGTAALAAALPARRAASVDASTVLKAQ